MRVSKPLAQLEHTGDLFPNEQGVTSAFDDVPGCRKLKCTPRPSLPISATVSARLQIVPPTHFSFGALVDALGVQEQLADHCTPLVTSGDVIARTPLRDHVQYGILLKCPHFELLYVLRQ